MSKFDFTVIYWIYGVNILVEVPIRWLSSFFKSKSNHFLKYMKFGWLTKLWIRITTLKPRPSLTQPQRRKRILQDEYKTFRNRNQTNTAARSLLVNIVPISFWGETRSIKLNIYLICSIQYFRSNWADDQSRYYLISNFVRITNRTCRISRAVGRHENPGVQVVIRWA